MFKTFHLKTLAVLALMLLAATPTLAQQATQAPTPAPTTAPTTAATQAAPVVPDTVSIGLGSNKDYPKFLVGNNGMTLYMFTADTINSSGCNDKCAVAWPPLLVKSADGIKVADGIPGKIDTFTRKDGTLQVSYNGQALYYWFKDKQPGDITGNRIGRTWWLVAPATVSIAYDAKLGQLLVGPTGMTLYMFSKDTAGVSNCSGDCAKAWPALTVKSAADIVPGVNLPGKFDVLTRDDGTLQVTYNGQALYYWAKDKAIGDSTGNGVGKVWSIVAPETVVAANTSALGTFLTTADGITLYTFSKDTAGVSTCSGDCATAWPPFLTNGLDRLTLGAGLSGKLDTIKRDDGKLQVTYNGLPLYLYKSDKAPGDTTGQGVGGVWNVAKG